MIKNYLITSFRNFYRNLGYSSINVGGLAIGLTASILILLWVRHQHSVNRSYPHADRLYQLATNYRYSSGAVETTLSTPGILGVDMPADFPEVEATARIDWGDEMLLRYEEKGFLVSGCWGDPAVFDLFGFPLVKGNGQAPMPNGNAIAISERTAARFFGTEEPLGKVFRVSERYDFTVTAVYRNIPTTSTLQFDFLIPYERKAKENTWLLEWSNTNDLTFVRLREGVSFDAFDARLRPYIKTKCSGCITEMAAQRVADTYLYNTWENGKPTGGRIAYVRVFTLVAFFILLIACINFMNLATARSATRSREVGVRKVVGAERISLIARFVGESVLLSLLSLAIAVVLVQLLLPVFNSVVNEQIVFRLADPKVFLSLLAIALATGVVAGSYPAFFLSSFMPANVLKGSVSTQAGGARLRKGLVVFQFTLTVILIVGSLVAYRQIDYLYHKNLGLDRANVVYFNITTGLNKTREAFRTELKKSAAISHVTYGGHIPFNHGSMTLDVDWAGKPEDDMTPFSSLNSDHEFLPTLGIPLAAGRNFEGLADSTRFLVNESFVRQMNLTPEEAINHPVRIWGTDGTILGVFKDYHLNSIKQKIGAMFIVYQPENTWRVFVKIKEGQTTAALEHMTETLKRFDPAYPFDYHFLDEAFDELHRSDVVIQKLAIGFTAIAIFISCLGLFGLASFTAEQRKKEIGIRKAMGATVPHLVVLLCRDFTRLVFFALLIGLPMAWYSMHRFLQSYAYHTSLDWPVFALTGALIFVIALTTVVYQSAKAALSNPVDSLRNE
ncbi:MAG: ABC transporter permease [Cyclobacteriaceae bacterium]|nr:ABC transporter permease [Cyclobacteriaceae bacterium]